MAGAVSSSGAAGEGVHRGARGRRRKWVSILECDRAKNDLPAVFSILIYTHPETGCPLAICDGIRDRGPDRLDGDEYFIKTRIAV